MRHKLGLFLKLVRGCGMTYAISLFWTLGMHKEYHKQQLQQHIVCSTMIRLLKAFVPVAKAQAASGSGLQRGASTAAAAETWLCSEVCLGQHHTFGT